MRTGMNGSSFCYAKSIHCRLVIVISGTHNADVLSTTAVNDLVMILYYDPCYTLRSSRSKEGVHKNVDTDLVVLVVATVNELDFWECAHSCPLYCSLSWQGVMYTCKYHCIRTSYLSRCKRIYRNINDSHF